MCCSVSPNVQVLFSNTILYAAEIVNSEGKTVHALGYQNTAQNNFNSILKEINSTAFPPYEPSGFWNKLRNIFSSQTARQIDESTEKSTGNAMLLPFPALQRTMSQENILDTKNCPGILKDIADAVKPPPSLSFGLSRSPVAIQAQSVQIFEAAGIYTVVLAQNAYDIPDALSRVPKEKRPMLNPQLFEAYAKWYPDWTFALCCFNNEEAREALPMLWWYEPMFPEKLFLPALDSHTGAVPKLHNSVKVDHTIAVGSSFSNVNSQQRTSAPICPECKASNPRDMFYCLNCGNTLQQKTSLQDHYHQVSYKNIIPSEVKPYLLSKVMGQVYNEVMPNGDFICQIDQVRDGIWNPIRSLPSHS